VPIEHRFDRVGVQRELGCRFAGLDGNEGRGRPSSSSTNAEKPGPAACFGAMTASRTNSGATISSAMGK
jgi:hypothetical protein